MKAIKYLSVIFAFALVSSCSVSAPVLITNNTIGKKTGKAEYSVILGFIRPMDADIGIAKAAKNGKITKIATVDYQVKSGFFKTTYTTIVTGE
jgi:hypothetical protein